MPHLMILSPCLMFCVAILWPSGISCCRLKVLSSALTVVFWARFDLAIPILSLTERIRRLFWVFLLSILISLGLFDVGIRLNCLIIWSVLPDKCGNERNYNEKDRLS